MLVSAKVTDTDGSQLSDAATVGAGGGSSPQIIETSAGTPTITGIVLSSTVMFWTALVVLPQSSVAIHVLSITYLSAQSPLTVIEVNSICTFGSQLSVATTGSDKVGTLLHSKVTSLGTFANTGGSGSPETVIVCDARLVLPQASSTVHVLSITYESVQSNVPSVLVSFNVICGLASQLSNTSNVAGGGAG